MKISVRTMGLILGPLLFVIISKLDFMEVLSTEAWDVLGVAAWMITWWVTEATPLAVAALLPIIMFPALGIFNLTESTASYANSVIFLFMGGFFVTLGYSSSVWRRNYPGKVDGNDRAYTGYCRCGISEPNEFSICLSYSNKLNALPY